MKKTTQRWLWIALGLTVVLSVAWRWLPTGGSAGRLSALPLQGFGYSGRDLPLTPAEVQVYQKADAIKRLYQTRSERFVLTAIDGANNRHAVHDPLYCFRGDGWQVLQQRGLTLPGGQASLLTLGRGDQRAEALFWFTNGRERHTSATRAWLMSLWKKATFGHAGYEPKLVVLQPVTGGTANWDRIFAQCPFLFEI